MKKGPSRLARTVRSLLAMIGLGAGLAVFNSVTLARDVATATGPVGEAQHQFFVAAADRPDIELFYKKFSHEQKMIMAERLGEYQDPLLAKVIGKLVGTFDAEARSVLTKSLTKAAAGHPDAVASQLTQTGSLQIVALNAALVSFGPEALPAVAKQLEVTDARNNAVAYLVAAGKPSVPFLLPELKNEKKEVRLAAADALGKIGADEAVTPLTALYNGAKDDERFGYLSALSGIGSPESEALLTAAAEDENLTNSRRAQAMLGLGRVGTPSAIQKLWSLSISDDPQVRDAVVSGLQLAKESVLASAPNPSLGLRVASGLSGAASDSYIGRALQDATLVVAAADAAHRRPSLVAALTTAAKVSREDGTVTDALMRALGSTPEGLTSLRTLANDPTVGGFAFRRLRLLNVGS